MSLPELFQQACLRVVRAAGFDQPDDSEQVRARLRDEGVLPTEEELPAILREQAD